MAARESKVTRSSGNVFEDLGVPDADAMLAKAALVARIVEVIRSKHISQKRAGEILGIDQPKVSALLNGHLRGFSTDRLFRFLNALGRDVEITVKPRPRTSTRPGIRVVDPQKRKAG